MPKYYVLSGEARVIVEAQDENTAAVNLMGRISTYQKEYADFIYVSEKGFGDIEGLDDDGFLFLTKEILENIAAK